MDRIARLNKMISDSRSIVFFGGAGVSTESGIPDYRSVDGLYNQTFDYPPETMLSHSFFRSHTSEFFRFYRTKMLSLDARPNAAHFKLAELEAIGKLTAVVTQNVDGLHYAAGSKNVLELHGSVHRNTCLECGRNYDAQFICQSENIPRCQCGGIVKPDVVLYEESLDNDVMDRTVDAIADADMLIVGGTSLAVYPAASFVRYYRGNRLVIINLQPTPYDDRADLLICGKIGEIMSQINID